MSEQQILDAFVGSYAVRANVLVAGWSGLRVAQALAGGGLAARVVLWAPEGVPGSPAPNLLLRTGPLTEVTSDEGAFDLVYSEEDLPLDAIRSRWAGATFIFAGAALRRAPEDAEWYAASGGRVLLSGNGATPALAVRPASRARRLHLACGPHALGGWVNIDNQPYPGIDRLLDLRNGLPFANVETIYAEHFIEHVEYRDALSLLTECRRALAPDGVIRLSTPNLDWVWAFAYHPGMWETAEQEIHDCLVANRSFRAWGHRFLYNRAMLREVLQRAGFAEVTFCRYGESEHEALRNVEGHEPYVDTPEIPHVLIAEGRGIRDAATNPEIDREIAEYERDLGTV
ncbi:MAG TPA: methyltransferase domain-containing protein [Thermoanaerobaculia bacterium]|nr:methyltransferase domain-containing protein [Thermoanaerobaculia bacterium]